MTKENIIRLPSNQGSTRLAILAAQPESLEIDLDKTAIIVIDMQNAFAAKGGMHELHGKDISGTRKIIPAIQSILEAGRKNKVKIIYLVHNYSAEDSPSPNSPSWYKRAAKTLRERPEQRRAVNFEGEWGAEIVPELKPNAGEMVVVKPRYSAFFGTNLDSILRNSEIKFLIFVGVSSNVCVDTSIRDAFNMDYFSVLLKDASSNNGEQSAHEVALSTIKGPFGWVSDAASVLAALNTK